MSASGSPDFASCTERMVIFGIRRAGGMVRSSGRSGIHLHLVHSAKRIPRHLSGLRNGSSGDRRLLQPKDWPQRPWRPGATSARAYNGPAIPPRGLFDTPRPRRACCAIVLRSGAGVRGRHQNCRTGRPHRFDAMALASSLSPGATPHRQRPPRLGWLRHRRIRRRGREADRERFPAMRVVNRPGMWSGISLRDVNLPPPLCGSLGGLASAARQEAHKRLRQTRRKILVLLILQKLV